MLISPVLLDTNMRTAASNLAPKFEYFTSCVFSAACIQILYAFQALCWSNLLCSCHHGAGIIKWEINVWLQMVAFIQTVIFLSFTAFNEWFQAWRLSPNFFQSCIYVGATTRPMNDLIIHLRFLGGGNDAARGIVPSQAAAFAAGDQALPQGWGACHPWLLSETSRLSRELDCPIFSRFTIRSKSGGSCRIPWARVRFCARGCWRLTLLVSSLSVDVFLLSTASRRLRLGCGSLRRNFWAFSDGSLNLYAWKPELHWPFGEGICLTDWKIGWLRLIHDAWRLHFRSSWDASYG